ncbi:rRNA biogenesis protein RRP5 isoform X2 [Aristolochia californica]|uniref:rRNA biogenesis protein RRP5 isoform X2 n=1 Tax=Aristolochia californica TaxID=171875 RepID=UPI0035D92646
MVAPSSKSRKGKTIDGLKPKKTAMKSKKRKHTDEPENGENKLIAARKSDLMPLCIEDDVPDFPRGGGSILTRQEEEEARAEAEAEFNAEDRELKKKRKASKKSWTDEDDLGSLFGGGFIGKLPRLANKITLKNISPGMKLWGMVVEVNSKDLVISLPGGLRGFVRAEEASDLFSENGVKDAESNFLCSIFHVGQLVPSIVLQVDEDNKQTGGSKRIRLSLRLALLHKALTLDSVQNGMVLSAYIKSVEDHGYILLFGSSSFSGFLPNNSKEGSCEMHIGQLVHGVVRSIDKARGVVHLNCDPDLVANSVIKDLKGLSIDLLVPGMMVTARVQAQLYNGLMLSFLTYFTGTVDIFHLQNYFPNATWRDSYSENKRVTARILFIDPSTRAIGLSMNSHLLHYKAPPFHVKTGEIFDTARVVRVDRGFGLLLEIPSSPLATPGYVMLHDVADEEVRKLDKKFKEGKTVRLRILGFKHMEGIATGTLKATSFEGSVFTHSDVKPGMHVKAKIISVDHKGALVQLSDGVKALCPVSHMSEFEFPKPSAKFKVGAQLLFRVLGCKSKRITVTHKKTLVRSKLDILASYADATDGFITHGWIEKLEKHGCFVRFYSGVKGFAHRSELGLDPGSDPSSMFHVGQVVKCRVISVSPSSRKISLSFITSTKRACGNGKVPKVGSFVSGTVARLTPSAVIVQVNAEGYVKGAIYNEHLADHLGHSELMKSLLKMGYEFDQLLVLDVEGDSLILSAKYSLINSADQLPHEVEQVHPHSVIHGYICNMIESGYFIRFLGRLTGFAPKDKAVDDQKADASEAFYIGQSVRSHVLSVDGEKGRIKLALKQSSCFSTDASFINGYFVVEEKIAKLKILDSSTPDLRWVEKFKVGSLVEGEIQEIKEFGVVVSFKDQSDVIGFITHYQLNGKVGTGSIVQATVLDVSKLECIVDLSLKPEFVSESKDAKGKKRKRGAIAGLEVHQTVHATVEIVKENYLVLSLPEYGHAIGYASLYDYNTQKLPHKHFVNGQSVLVTVEDLPSHSPTGKLLLLLKTLSEVADSSSSKRAKKKSSYHVGSVVQAEITHVKPLELWVKFGIGFYGRVHITEMLTARIIAKRLDVGKTKKRTEWELSIKPSMLAETGETDNLAMDDRFRFSVGEVVSGYVRKVDSEWVWLIVSRNVSAHLFLLDSSCEPSELQMFQKKFSVGQVVSGYIMSINQEKRLLRIMLCPPSARQNTHLEVESVKLEASGTTVTNDNKNLHILQGDLIGGRISKIFPGVGGLVVQIGPHLYGKVHFTELKDGWVSDPLEGYHEGDFVKCKVLEISRSFKGTTHVELSLRAALGELQFTTSETPSNDMHSYHKRYEEIEELHPSMEVQGYVKNVMPKGCFIMLSRKIEARILLSNLSDGFIVNLEQEFPVGKLVKGKVLSVDPLSKRVEVTLKKTTAVRESKLQLGDLCDLHIGDVISGTIRRVESYGLFITIDHTNVVGLCHISELSDNQIDHIEVKYKAGERVVAKILKVDEERLRVSLGMKNSYMEDDPSTANHELDEPCKGNNTIDSECGPLQACNFDNAREASFDQRNSSFLVLAQLESRASIPPLTVPLDDLEGSDSENVVTQTRDETIENNSRSEKNLRKQKKKEKEKREMEIRAAEDRLKEKYNKPETADDYEKLVRSSPNNSFVWIQYMDFMLSLADVERARSIAERALTTINFREEGEKLNIWVAYLNLEKMHGDPPEEAVVKIFQRALQYCDQKKIHLALLELYQRTEQHKLADELLEKMVKKFKNSCKVWLRRVQSLLKQEKDGVQSIVKRALLSLPRHKHIKFISHTAILEFRCGVPDRGRSMFEGVLKEYPKRTDLWIVYLDQEICQLKKKKQVHDKQEVLQEDGEIVRALFERATCLSLPPKKMKAIFKKFLEFEKSFGDEERVEFVKKKALEYVEG